MARSEGRGDPTKSGILGTLDPVRMFSLHAPAFTPSGVRMTRRFALPPALLFVGLLAPSAAAQPAGEELFEKHIRPLLVEKCLSCHGPEKPKSGLRLDTRE